MDLNIEKPKKQKKPTSFCVYIIYYYNTIIKMIRMFNDIHFVVPKEISGKSHYLPAQSVCDWSDLSSTIPTFSFSIFFFFFPAQSIFFFAPSSKYLIISKDSYLYSVKIGVKKNVEFGES